MSTPAFPLHNPAPLEQRELRVIFLDVGQGDSTLIVYPDNSLTLVDCGSIKNSTIVGPIIRDVIQSYAAKNGNVINNLVLTHPDQDHYNLIPALFGPGSDLTVDWVYYGGDLDGYKNNGRDRNRTYQFLAGMVRAGKAGPPPHTNSAWPDPRLSRASVDVTIPAANFSHRMGRGDANENSIVLRLEYQNGVIWLMGDATESVEEGIIQWARNNQTRLYGGDVSAYTYFFGTEPDAFTDRLLKMGHHGSMTSSCQEFVEAITPTILAISADTLAFSGRTGMPAYQHLKDVMGWSELNEYELSEGSSLAHWFVYFDTRGERKFRQSAATQLAVCSTVYNIHYAAGGVNYDTEGGAWYFSLIPGAAPGEFIAGWTGPELPEGTLVNDYNPMDSDPMEEDDDEDEDESMEDAR